MNFDRLRYVAERADVGAQREALLAVEIPEAPGSFLRFCELLGKRSVTEFNYRYRDSQDGAALRRSGACARANRERSALVKSMQRGGLPGARHDRRRDGEAARALHGRRPAARPRATSGCTASSFPSGRARCSSSCTPSARVGTSACSTTAITARTTAACSPESRCPRHALRTFLLHLNELQYAVYRGDRQSGLQDFPGCRLTTAAES